MLLAHSTSLPRRQLSTTTIATPYTYLPDYTTQIHTSFDQLFEYPSHDDLQVETITSQFLEQPTAGPESPSSSEIRRSQETQLMQSEQSDISNSWPFSNGNLTPSSTHNHQRESSLSSLGSAGPASPYDYNTSHPQVVLSPDSAGETYHDGLPVSDQATYYNFSKTPSHMPQETYLPVAFQQNYNFHSYNNQTNYNAMMPMERQPMHREDETMSLPDYGHSGRPSVASTRGSPATPIGDGFEEPNRKVGETSLQDPWMSDSSQIYPDSDYHNSNTIPKLDRTMSDAYNDELYSPNFTFTSAASSQETQMLSPSRHSDIFSQRLQAANNQHLTASAQSQLGNQSRRMSPFRQGSPLAPVAHRQFNQPSQQVRLGTAAHMREQQKAESDARVLEEQIRRSSPEHSTPKTISPKDALLDYHATEEDAAMPLFPPPTQQYRLSKPMVQELQDLDDSSSQQSFASMLTSRRPSSSAYSNSSQATPHNRSVYGFAPPSVPGSTHVPQQYQFVAQQQRQHLHDSPDRASQFSETLAKVESSSNGYAPIEAVDLKKPAKSNADSGTYTCTYHGCTLRFETPAKLQKHKREGHRQSAPLGGVSASERRDSDGGSGMTSAALLRNSQAGPHKCERINPSTGKPCNAIFSRPYDLTRHEDTIHNARKQKVHCHICTEEKTFSRNDALTRHMRVVHPDVDFPGKTRRRG